MAFSFSPKIVTNGLVLALDAANARSYTSGSLVWNDLTANGNTGTLTNGPTFNSANGGNIVFDGVDDAVICGNAPSINITIGTISAWIKTTTPGSSYRGVIVKKNAWGLFLFNNILATYDWGNTSQRSTGINLADGNWKNIVMSFTETIGEPANNAIIYLNGISVLTTTVKHLSQNENLLLGYGNTSPQYFNGNISSALVYNRVLPPSEVLQNYNATKSRFNLT